MKKPQPFDLSDVPYDNWANLVYDIPEVAVTQLGTAEKPSANKSYNMGDGEGIDITSAANEDADGVLTLRIRATGTGGSTAMSFHSLTSENEELRPHVIVTISNPVIAAYEETTHEQLPEESVPAHEGGKEENQSNAGKQDKAETVTVTGNATQDGHSSVTDTIEASDTEADTTVPLTADESPLELWLGLMVVSAFAFVIVIIRKVNSPRREKSCASK